MTQKIGMNVEATFDTRRVDQGIDDLNRKIDQVNRKPINPVSPQAARQLDALNQKFQQLLKVDGELRRRVNATGQKGRLFEDIDWSATHPDKSARMRKLDSVHEYLGLPGVQRPHAPPPPNHPPPPRNPGGSGGAGFGGIVTGAAQAGLRAAGPVGGVASSAMGTGLASGAGAGLMGLMGGLLALGVSKIVGGVMEKVGQAEDNNVAYDRLKRTLGDVNVSFAALKTVVTANAENFKVTYAEMGQYSQQFAKAANLKDNQYTSIGDEVGVGIGMSRAFGLDPSQGVGVMGQMRGLGVTSNTQESRKFALLIGETIGKSGAFAKADEVMEAIGNYAAIQTRNSMGGANVSGFGGMYSSMVGSGIAGLDPSGAASILGRINANLSAGGAKGEASQFFTAMVGNRMGLDPLQTQVMREGGAFATNSGMFGKDSAYARYMGHTGPAGNKTFLQSTIDTLNQQYGGNSDDQKLLRAQAFANHTGINMNQSMAMLSLKPNQMGDMEKYAGDITKLNASGIGNLAKVVSGSDQDRQSVANSLLRRTDVSAEEKSRINDVMRNGSTDEQKQLLATLVASREQERTTGSDIRDSKNALDNIKTSLADKLVPITLEMRHGIMAIAGVGKNGTTSQDILKQVIEADSAQRLKSALGKTTSERNELEERKGYLENKRRSLDPTNLATTYKDKPEILEQKMKERANVLSELNAVDKRLKEITEEQEAIKKEENKRKEQELAGLRASAEARLEIDGAIGGGSGAGRSGAGGASAVGPMDPKKRDEAMKFFMDKSWTREQAAGLVANLGAESGLNEGITGDNGAAYGLAQWHGDRQREFEKKYGKSIKNSTFREQLDFVNHELTDGNEKAAGDLLKKANSAGQAADWMTRYYERPADKDGQSRVRAAAAEKIMKEGTPLPAGAGAGRGEDPSKFVLKTEPIVVRHEDARGQEIKPAQTIQTRVTPATPFGGGR